MGIRAFIEEPITNENWNELPPEFNTFLDSIDEAKNAVASMQVVDPLYPNCDYDWEVDSDIALQTAVYYWNSDEELPDPGVIVEEITEALGEQAYDDWVSSAYSY